MKLKNQINRELSKLTTNKYFPEIPLKCLSIIFASFNVDTSFLDGIYTGRQGETNAQICPNLYWRMTWYRMESGNYEIVCYVS